MMGRRGPRPQGRRGTVRRVLALPVLVAVLGGCGGMPGAPAPGPPEPVPTQKVPSAIPGGPSGPPGEPAPDARAGSPSPRSPSPGGPAPGGPAPSTPGLPSPYCEGGPLDCRIYRSVSGRDASGELGWLNKQPLEVSSVFVNGTWTIGVKTPCNQLGVEVEVRAGQLIPGRTIATAMACLGPESGYEAWATQLFRQPVTLTRDGHGLVLRNGHGTVEFEDAGPNML